jgi:hypothetical protein
MRGWRTQSTPARLVLALLFQPPSETGNAGHNNGAIPAGLLAGERRVARTSASNHGRLPPYPKRSEDPSFRAERNRIEEAMPLAFGRFFVVDAHNSFEASRQIIFRLNQARADGWQVGNAVANAWHNESEITKDGLNSKLLFNLTPTIDRVDRLEPTLATMAAAQSQAQEKLARWERSIRPRAAGPGCVVLILASVSFTALLDMTIAFGPSFLA